MSRIQKLPPILWTGKPLTDKNTYVFFYSGKEKKVAKVDNPEIAMQKIVAATKAGYGAFASTFIPCNNQHGVFAFSTAGCTKEYVLAKNVNDMVNKAYESVFAKKETKPSKNEAFIQKIVPEKEDPIKMIVYIQYDGSTKLYAFRCRKWHLKGDRVCVNTNGEYKNVTVFDCKTMKESEVKALAKSIGYDDISELYCEQEILLEDEYKEDIDELRAMKECFTPACDYVTNPNPDSYTFEQKDNYEPEDYDDLPE